MDTDLPVIYRIHTPEPDYESRLKARKLPWRRGVPAVRTDERREFVAKLAQNAVADRKEQRQVLLAQKSIEAGQKVGNVITQQQGLGDALSQIATPQLVLHNAPADPAPVVVAPPQQPPPPPGGGGATRGRDPTPRPVPAAASSSAAASSATIAPSYPPARAPPKSVKKSQAPIEAEETDRSRSSIRGASVDSLRGADIKVPPTPRGRSIASTPSVRGVPIPAGGMPSRASSAEPDAQDSRDMLARSRSRSQEQVFSGMTADQLQRVYAALLQYAEIQKMWAEKGAPGKASRMTGRVDRRLALTR
jgi:hypothetical protein